MSFWQKKVLLANYFMSFWQITRVLLANFMSFGKFYVLLANFMSFWQILCPFGKLDVLLAKKHVLLAN